MIEITDAIRLRDAVLDKITEVERYAGRLQEQLLAHNGRTFYADLGATRTIETTLVTYATLPGSDPVPVPYPLQPGYWLSADLDSSGNRLTVQMDMTAFRAMERALMERNAAIWGRKQIHFATIEAMAAGGATAAQIRAYDITQGWDDPS